MLTEFIKYLKDDDGQTSTEYILLVAVVAMIVLKFKTTLNAKLNGVMESVFGKVTNSITNDL
jgi:pilus assembly protein Flp/PilA